MATPDGPRFEKVDQISSPGQYMFAQDLVNGSKEPLSNHGVVSGVVLGQRPNWDYTLEKYLQKRYPSTKWFYQERGDKNDSNFAWKNHDLPWTGQSGKILINEEFYRITTGPDLSFATTSRFSLEALNADGHPEWELPDYEIFGGLVEIEENYSRPKELYNGQPFWRGTVRLEGSQPREPIQSVIDQINEDIRERELPVFKDLSYRPPLSIIGPSFVPKERLYTQPE